MNSPVQTDTPIKEREQLWSCYAQTGSVECRNELLMLYIGLVKRIANRLIQSSGGYHDLDDLISCGVIGLMEAIERFDATRGAQFESYAQIRIKGAMIDYMRRQDWAPMHARQRFRRIEAVYQQVAQENGRPAMDQEVAENLGLPLADLQRILGEASLMNILYFEELLLESSTEDSYPGQDAQFDRELEERDLLEDLARQIGLLSYKEQLVLNLYYQDELTFKEIGLVLKLTESRISQIHSAAILKLRTGLTKNAQVCLSSDRNNKGRHALAAQGGSK